MAFLIGGANSDSGAYQIDNSLRFNDDDSPSMTIASLGSSSSNAKKWTVSFWAKLSSGLGGHRCVFSAGESSGGNYVQLNFTDGDELQLYSSNALGEADNTATNIKTNAKYRDVSAWYHVVWAIDTTQSTNTNRIKLYVNGAQVTSFATANNYPAQNTDNDRVGANNIDHFIGKFVDSSSQYVDGYLSDLYFIDGDAKAASDFGETNDNGVWIPKKYSGSFGNNGFKLEFQQTGTSANASGMGADTSGNGNHLTPSNLAATDVTTDTPTNNFCTLNSIDPIQGAAYSEGNCKVVTNSSNRNYVTGTFGLTSGKWYWEAKLTAVTNDDADQAFFGIADLDDRGVNSTGQSLGDRANEVGWHQEEGKYQRNNSWSSAHTDSWGIGDICAIALDCDNNRVTIAKNGQWADGSGNADESSPTSFVTYTASTMTPAMGEGGGGTEATWECNFGNPAFSISSGNADANGYGNFEYAVPSGYYALCTKNLAEYG